MFGGLVKDNVRSIPQGWVFRLGFAGGGLHATVVRVTILLMLGTGAEPAPGLVFCHRLSGGHSMGPSLVVSRGYFRCV